MSVRVLVAVTVALLAAVYALRCRADASSATARAARLDGVVRALELERDRAVRATVLRPHQRYDKEQADTLLPPLLVREAVRNALRDIAGGVPASKAASAARPTPAMMRAVDANTGQNSSKKQRSIAATVPHSVTVSSSVRPSERSAALFSPNSLTSSTPSIFVQPDMER